MIYVLGTNIFLYGNGENKSKQEITLIILKKNEINIKRKNGGKFCSIHSVLLLK